MPQYVLRALLRRPWIALALAITGQVAHFWASQSDVSASDPLWYAAIAHGISVDPSGMFAAPENHPFVMRIGLTAPLAVLYWLFGVSPFVTNLPSLLSVLVIMGVLYSAAPSPHSKLLVIALAFFSRPLLQFSYELNVDLPASAMMAVTVLCISRRDGASGQWWLVAAVTAWFTAFLVKETAIWCGVVWLYAIIVDIRRDGAMRVIRLYAIAVAVGFTLAVTYLGICAFVWDDPLARFHGIQQLDHAWSLEARPAADWVNRLSWMPPLRMYRLFKIPLILAVAASWLIAGRERIWLVSTAAFAFLFWFGTSKLTSYSPLPLVDRMLLPMLPGILLLSALVLERLLRRPYKRQWIYVTSVIALVLCISPGIRRILADVRRGTPEADAFAIVVAEAATTAHPIVVVCGEPRCVSAGNFYFGFRTPEHVRIVFADDFVALPPPDHTQVYAIANVSRARTYAERVSDRTQPMLDLGLPRLGGDSDVYVFDAGDGVSLWHALRNTQHTD